MNSFISLTPQFSFFAWLTCGCLATIGLASRARAQPPAWPDAQPVANGCYLSTAVYLAKLREHHPDVAARAENVRLPSGKLHTIAVVPWGREVYLRDMFIGVAAVRGDAQDSFDAALAQWRRHGGRHGFRERAASTLAERWLEVEAAAQWIAALHPQIIQVFSARGPIPVLWWTTANGELALYEPSVGTAIGHTQRPPLEVANELFGAPMAAANTERRGS